MKSLFSKKKVIPPSSASSGSSSSTYHLTQLKKTNSNNGSFRSASSSGTPGNNNDDLYGLMGVDDDGLMGVGVNGTGAVIGGRPDNSRYFSNNMDIDYSQGVESYGELIHPKEFKDDKPSTGPTNNLNLSTTTSTTNDDSPAFESLVLSKEEQEWADLMRVENTLEVRNASTHLTSNSFSSSTKSGIGSGSSSSGIGSNSTASSASNNSSNSSNNGGENGGEQASVDREGWMVKEGRIVKSWKKRWFVLSGNTLEYYAAKNTKKKGSVLLDGAKITLATGRAPNNHNGCLSLIAREVSEEDGGDDNVARTLFFDTEDEKERHEWFVAINNKVAKLKYETQMKRVRLNPDLRVLNFFDHIHDTKSLNLAIESDNLMTLNLKRSIDHVINAIKEPIKYHKSLTTLNLSHCVMRDATFLRLSASLADNTSLTELNLAGNELTAESMKMLAKVLAKHPALQSLTLDHNLFDDDSLIAFSNAVVNNANSKLTYVSFHFNKIGDAGVESLTDMLKKKSSTIKWSSLHLSHNVIGDDGATKIGQTLLAGNAYPSLTELNLGWNRIQNAGSSSIANALKSNKSLKSLDLEYNKIEYDGIKSLAFMIVDNTTLDTIALGGNKLGEQAIVLLASTDMNVPELELSTKLSNTDQEEETGTEKHSAPQQNAPISGY